MEDELPVAVGVLLEGLLLLAGVLWPLEPPVLSVEVPVSVALVPPPLVSGLGRTTRHSARHCAAHPPGGVAKEGEEEEEVLVEDCAELWSVVRSFLYQEGWLPHQLSTTFSSSYGIFFQVPGELVSFSVFVE